MVVGHHAPSSVVTECSKLVVVGVLDRFRPSRWIRVTVETQAVIGIDEHQLTAQNRVGRRCQPTIPPLPPRSTVGRRDVGEGEVIGVCLAPIRKDSGCFERLNGTLAFEDSLKTLVEIRVEDRHISGRGLRLVEVVGVLAVGVVPLIRRQVPHHPQPETGMVVHPFAQPTQQTELQEIPDIPRVPILHLRRLPQARRAPQGRTRRGRIPSRARSVVTVVRLLRSSLPHNCDDAPTVPAMPPTGTVEEAHPIRHCARERLTPGGSGVKRGSVHQSRSSIRSALLVAVFAALTFFLVASCGGEDAGSAGLPAAVETLCGYAEDGQAAVENADFETAASIASKIDDEGLADTVEEDGFDGLAGEATRVVIGGEGFTVGAVSGGVMEQGYFALGQICDDLAAAGGGGEGATASSQSVPTTAATDARAEEAIARTCGAVYEFNGALHNTRMAMIPIVREHSAELAATSSEAAEIMDLLLYAADQEASPTGSGGRQLIAAGDLCRARGLWGEGLSESVIASLDEPPTVTAPTSNDDECVGVSTCGYENGIDFQAVYAEVGTLVADGEGAVVSNVDCDGGPTPPNRVEVGDSITCEFFTEDAGSGEVLLTVEGDGRYSLDLVTFAPFAPVD